MQHIVSLYLENEIESVSHHKLAHLVLRQFTEQASTDMEQWTPTLVRIWRDQLKERLEPRSINTYLAVLASFCKWAHEEGHLPRNPCTKVKRLPIQDEEAHPLTKQQQALLRDMLDLRGKPLDRAIILALLHTGLRASELVNLALSDVQLGEHGITLAGARDAAPDQFRTGKLTVRYGKGNKTRSLPLNASARKALIEWMSHRPDSDLDRVFISPQTKKPIKIWAVEYACEKYQNVIPGLHPHQLRATFATRCSEAGVPIEVVSGWLGHSNINVTRRYYIAIGARADAIEKIVDEEDV